MAGETVLIIEDRRENIVHLANNVLKPNGYQVLTAMDGQRGLRRILTDKPDLIIMDLNMPKMDGLEVLAALKENQVSTPVILTTFYGSEHVAQQALRLGAADYIVKPYNVAEMLKAIEKALARPVPAPARSPADNGLDKQPLPTRAPANNAMEQVIPLTRQMERWMRDMNILARVGKALVAQLELDRVYIRAVEAAIYVTRADYAFLYIQPEQDRGSLHLKAARGPHDPRARLLDRPVESGLAIEAARSGAAEIRPKAPADVVIFEVVGTTLGPAIATPLHWQHEAVGVVMVARAPNEHPFGEPDAEWLNGLAEYAAIAVHNARACQARSQAVTVLSSHEVQLPAWQREVDEIARQLQAVTERLQQLAGTLKGK